VQEIKAMYETINVINCVQAWNFIKTDTVKKKIKCQNSKLLVLSKAFRQQTFDAVSG
jgi:hypothetical protein